jgi:hypothetical protein
MVYPGGSQKVGRDPNVGREEVSVGGEEVSVGGERI